MEIEIIIGLITGAGSALSAAILFLYRNVVDLHQKHTDTMRQLGQLQGNQEGIRQLSKQVLDTVHRAAVERRENRNDR